MCVFTGVCACVRGGVFLEGCGGGDGVESGLEDWGLEGRILIINATRPTPYTLHPPALHLPPCTLRPPAALRPGSTGTASRRPPGSPPEPAGWGWGLHS